LQDTDKTIEVIKAAMEKENKMKDRTKESMDEQIDAKVMQEEKLVDADMEEAIDILSEEEAAETEEPEEDLNAGGDGVETQSKGDSEGKKAGKSFFKNSKNKELEAKDIKIEELTDRLMRNMAEFDNFRKRTEKEKAQMYDIGAKSIIEKLLPIVDNFERGLGAITEKDKESAFAQGIEMIYKQLTNALEEIGVKQIEAIGKEFDPAFHNAVMHGEDESLGENIISEEFQKGYIYRDLVIRHSMVKVVN
jgi:molecular chaperone GrpE